MTINTLPVAITRVDSPTFCAASNDSCPCDLCTAVEISEAYFLLELVPELRTVEVLVRKAALVFEEKGVLS